MPKLSDKHDKKVKFLAESIKRKPLIEEDEPEVDQTTPETKYVVLSGMRGYLPDYSAVYDTFEQAVDSLLSMFGDTEDVPEEVFTEMEKELKENSYFDFPSKYKHQFGAQYCEVTETTDPEIIANLEESINEAKKAKRLKKSMKKIKGDKDASVEGKRDEKDIKGKKKIAEAVEEDEEPTKVVFRKFKEDLTGDVKRYGDVIAFFPQLADTMNPNQCSSYMHVGQHSSADVALIKTLQKATPEEYAPLKKELERIGYKLIVADEATKEDAAMRQATIKRWSEMKETKNKIATPDDIKNRLKFLDAQEAQTQKYAPTNSGRVRHDYQDEAEHLRKLMQAGGGKVEVGQFKGYTIQSDKKNESKIIKKPLPKISEATHDGGSAIHVKVFVEGELQFEEIFDDAETAAKNVIELFDGVTDKNIDDAKKNGTMEFEHNGKKHKIVFKKTTRRDFSNREKNID